MFKREDLTKEWYRPGEVGKMLGVTSRTILLYNENGSLKMRKDEDTNRWYASKEAVIDLLKQKGLFYEEELNNLNILYARVDTRSEYKDGTLALQIQTLIESCKHRRVDSFKVLSDVGRCTDLSNHGFNDLIDLVLQQKVDTVYVTEIDRLATLGIDFVIDLFSKFGTKIVALYDDSEYHQEVLVSNAHNSLLDIPVLTYREKSRLSSILNKIPVVDDDD